MKRMVPLSASLEPRHNSFNLLRLVAALIVLASHSFLLASGNIFAEPLSLSTPYTLGQHAVNGFFVLSGLTLAQSLYQNPDISRFAFARIMRIFPGLFAFGAFFAFVTGPFLTTLTGASYFSDFHTFLYPLAVLLRFDDATPPHGLFTQLPVHDAVNSSLWTIQYELIAYLGLMIAFMLGMLRFKWLIAAQVVLALALFLAAELAFPHDRQEDGMIHHLTRYALCFAIGVAAFSFRNAICLNIWHLGACAAFIILVRGTALEEVGYFVLAALLVLYLGAFDFGAATRWAQKNDISFGTYIYAWPTQQTVLTFMPSVDAWLLTAASVPVVIALAWSSWVLVERPALQLKRNPAKQVDA